MPQRCFDTFTRLCVAELLVSVALLIGVVHVGAWVGPPSSARAADRIYWSNSTGPPISFVNMDRSGSVGTLNTTGATTSEPAGVAIDTATSRIYWANHGTDATPISWANLDGSGGGNLTTAGATARGATGVTIDSITRRIYWANSDDNNAPISWARLDGSGGGNLNTLGADVNQASGVTVDAVTGRIYWANHGDNTIAWANLDGSGGGTLNTFGAVNQPIGVAISGGVIYWTNYGGAPGPISWANLDGSSGGNLSTPGGPAFQPVGVAVDPFAGLVYWTNTAAAPVGWARLNGTGGGIVYPVGAPNTAAFLALAEAPHLTPGPTANTAPAITQTGSSLTCWSGQWADGSSGFLYVAPRSFAYQWSLDGIDIPGATSPWLTPTSAGSLTCRVTASNAAGSTSQTSLPYAASPTFWTLTVLMTGRGRGTVTSSPAGINCPGGCASRMVHGTAVSLTAHPAAGSTFAGWSGGGCTGTGTCSLTLTGDRIVTAGFSLLPPPPPVAGVPGRVGTLGSVLKFGFMCRGISGQRCKGTATATAIAKLGADARTIVGVLAGKPRTGRYRMVVVARGSFAMAAGRSSAIAIRLNALGQTLRSKFKNVPADVQVSAGGVGLPVKLIRAARVTFGPDPPKVGINRPPVPKHSSVTLEMRCRGLAKQVCQGSVQITTFENLTSAGKIGGLAYDPSGRGRLVVLGAAVWTMKTAKNVTLTVKLNRAAKTLFGRFARIPARVTIAPSYNGYSLAPLTAKINIGR